MDDRYLWAHLNGCFLQYHNHTAIHLGRGDETLCGKTMRRHPDGRPQFWRDQGSKPASRICKVCRRELSQQERIA